jgi:HD-GYP domain-containing protein (c-di-GMP phosphodiesterase class II)
MPQDSLVRYRDNSLAPLMRSLASRYSIRKLPALPWKALAGVLDKADRSDKADPSHHGGAPTVVLVDLAEKDLPDLNDLAHRASIRLVGVLPPDPGPTALIHQPSDLFTEPSIDPHAAGRCFAVLPATASEAVLAAALEAAFANIELKARENDARQDFQEAEREREELNRIGIALSSTHDVGALLKMILTKAREIASADAGSLYVVEETKPQNDASGQTERTLRFKFTQNDSRQFPFTEFTLPISEDSMAGYTALHGDVIALDDVYEIPADCPYHFNPRYDEETGYRTRSLLTVPMKNARNEVLGVLQLLNCKRNRATQLRDPADFDLEVQPFPARSVNMVLSLASQAAVAYENSRLYLGTERLLEGFVQAAVTAIEQRDPTTSGHSMRVATMTLGLAEAVNRVSHGPYADARFTPSQMKEIRYAALLHDFGKVGVHEEVLVKAKKLYPTQLTILQHRFDFVRKELDAELAQRKLAVVLARGMEASRDEFPKLEEEYRLRHGEIDDYFRFILEANDPTVLPAGNFERLAQLAHLTFRDPRGREHRLVTPDEISSLSIPQGTLNEDERKQIESHVVHSFNFLIQIPWTRDLEYVPWIAGAHHEKINGTGYPHCLRGDEIPVQARMMTVCDIFDALSAADRPYKKAVSVERALDILKMCVRDQELDPEMFRIFVDAHIYQLTKPVVGTPSGDLQQVAHVELS